MDHDDLIMDEIGEGDVGFAGDNCYDPDDSCIAYEDVEYLDEEQDQDMNE